MKTYPRKINMVKAKNIGKGPKLSIRRRNSSIYYALYKAAKIISFISKHYNFEKDTFNFEIEIAPNNFKYYYDHKHLLLEAKSENE